MSRKNGTLSSPIDKHAAGIVCGLARIELERLQRQRPGTALITGLKNVIALLESHAQPSRGVRSMVNEADVWRVVKRMRKIGCGHYEAAHDIAAENVVTAKINRARSEEARQRLQSPSVYDKEFKRARAALKEHAWRSLGRHAKVKFDAMA